MKADNSSWNWMKRTIQYTLSYIHTLFVTLNPTNLDVSHWWKLKDENEMKLSSLSCISSNTANFVLSKLYALTQRNGCTTKNE